MDNVKSTDSAFFQLIIPKYSGYYLYELNITDSRTSIKLIYAIRIFINKCETNNLF